MMRGGETGAQVDSSSTRVSAEATNLLDKTRKHVREKGKTQLD